MCVYLSRVGLCRSNPWWWWDATRPTPRRRKELGSVQNRKFSLWISGLSWLWLCAIGVSSCGIFHHKPSIPGSSMTMVPPISFQHLFSPSWSTFPWLAIEAFQDSTHAGKRFAGWKARWVHWWSDLVTEADFHGDFSWGFTISDYTWLYWTMLNGDQIVIQWWLMGIYDEWLYQRLMVIQLWLDDDEWIRTNISWWAYAIYYRNLWHFREIVWKPMMGWNRWAFQL